MIKAGVQLTSCAPLVFWMKWYELEQNENARLEFFGGCKIAWTLERELEKLFRLYRWKEKKQTRSQVNG